MAFSDALGDDPANTAGNFLGVLGASILSGNRYEPFGNFGQLMALKNKEMQGQTSRAALKELLIQAGATPEQAEKFSASEGVAKLAIQNLENAKTDALGQSFLGGGSIGLGMGKPAMTPPAPPGPAAGVSMNGSQADKAKVWYSEAIKQGATPMEAAAMVGNFTAENGLNTSGKPGDSGTAFGGGQWRADRLNNLRALAEQRGEAWDSVPVQVAHTLNEMKGGDAGAARARALIAQAKTPEEAAAIFAQHFERPSRDALASSLPTRQGAAAQAYRMFGQGGTTQVADASGAVPVRPVTSAPLGTPKGVQVADDENQTQVLEGRMGMYPPSVYGVTKPGPVPSLAGQPAPAELGVDKNILNTAPRQTADARADMPAPGASEAGFVIPPGQPSEKAQTPQQIQTRDFARKHLQAEVDRLIAGVGVLGGRGDRGKALAEALKLKVQQMQKYLEPTDPEKIIAAAAEASPENRDLLLNSLPNQGQTATQKEYASYRKQELDEGRVPLSQMDYDVKLRTAGKTDINIRNDAEKKEEVGRAESVTKFLGGIADGAPATAKRAASLDQLGRLVSRTQTATGTTLKATIDGIGKELGVSSGELKTKADAINAIVNSLAPQMREPGTGTVSDADLRGFLAALPSLSATPEGNQLILAGLKRAVDIDRERTKIAAQWQAGKISASDARSKIAEIDERSIYASEAERSLVSGLSPIPDNKAAKGWRVLGVE